MSRDDGVYTLLVWSGSGTFDGIEVRGGQPGRDELLVCHERATRPLEIVNTGRDELIIFKFFGPDLNRERAAT